MSKVILRMKLPKDQKVIIFCIENWKMWVKHRILMREKLRFANNSVTPGLCDLQAFFCRWKHSDDLYAKYLSTLDFKRI